MTAAAETKHTELEAELLAVLRDAPDMGAFWVVDGFGVVRDFDRIGYVIAYSKWKMKRDAAIAKAVRS